MQHWKPPSCSPASDGSRGKEGSSHAPMAPNQADLSPSSHAHNSPDSVGATSYNLNNGTRVDVDGNGVNYRMPTSPPPGVRDAANEEFDDHDAEVNQPGLPRVDVDSDPPAPGDGVLVDDRGRPRLRPKGNT